MAAWDRLSATSAEFCATERGISVIWGSPSWRTAPSAAASTLPVATMLSWNGLLTAAAGVVAAVKFSKAHAERIGALLRAA